MVCKEIKRKVVAHQTKLLHEAMRKWETGSTTPYNKWDLRMGQHYMNGSSQDESFGTKSTGSEHSSLSYLKGSPDKIQRSTHGSRQNSEEDFITAHAIWTNFRFRQINLQHSRRLHLIGSYICTNPRTIYYGRIQHKIWLWNLEWIQY